MEQDVTIHYLEMHSPAQLRAKHAPRNDLDLVLVSLPLPELNRFFYTAIGGDWFWIDRLSWSYQDWMNYLNRNNLETWLFTQKGFPFGYCELEQNDRDVEIVYFGLLPAFAEQGLGGWALTCAAQRAWERGASRVWVHTCDLDHPAARENYRSRGFVEYQQETKRETLPEKLPGPWPNAR